MSDDHPMSGTNMPPRTTHDVDLGDGHFIDWLYYEGSLCGGVIVHTTTKFESGWCSGAFLTDDRYYKACGRTGPVWSLVGGQQQPTLSPSLLCHCGDHGWVRDGKWVRA